MFGRQWLGHALEELTKSNNQMTTSDARHTTMSLGTSNIPSSLPNYLKLMTCRLISRSLLIQTGTNPQHQSLETSAHNHQSTPTQSPQQTKQAIIMCLSIVTQSTSYGHLTYQAYPRIPYPLFVDDLLACPDYRVIGAQSDEDCKACQTLKLQQLLDS
jgi:hypothetical protein